MVKRFLVIGDDDLLKSNEVSRIKKEFIKKDAEDFDFSSYGPDNIYGLKEAINTLPLFSATRLILIKDYDMIPEADLSFFEEHIENDASNTVTIITVSSDFRKSPAFKTISKNAKVFSCDSPDKITIKKWIKSFLSVDAYIITDGAIDLIVELIGYDTRRVKNELEKLMAYSEGKEITESHVEDLIGRSVGENIFKLVDAINAGDGKWAFRVINDLYGQKKEAVEIVGYLSWYIKTIKNVKYLLSKKEDYNSVADKLGYSPAYIRRLADQSRKYTFDKIYKWTYALFKTDNDIKSGLKKPGIAIDTLIASFIG